MVRVDRRPRRHPRHRHRRRQGHARRAARCSPAPILPAYGGLKCNLPLKNRDGSPIRYTPRPALASDKVRFVGDPVACVVAETIAQAKDAAEAVALDIEPLPAVMSAREAAQPGAPQVWDEVPDNIALDYHYGDSAKVAEAFAKAAHVVKLPAHQPAPGGRLDRAARRHRRIRRQEREMDAAFLQPGRVRPEEHAARHLQRAGREDARLDRQCRRLVRHEGRGLSGICLHPARRQGARPPGEVDRRAFRQLRVRPSRPRLRHDGRDRLRRRRA